jgi:hypothetical protein
VAADTPHNLNLILDRAIDVIDCELEIVRMELEYPESIVSPIPDADPDPGSEPEAAPAPLARWNGTIAELLEYTIPPWAAGKLSKPSGKPMNYAEAVKFIETVYGITITDLYDRKTKILCRYKNTAFIDEMRRVLLEEAKKSIK